MARSNRYAKLTRKRKRAKTLDRLKRQYASTRREERTLVVEKLRRVAPWLREEYLQAKPRGG
jgi:hypothetical protein